MICKKCKISAPGFELYDGCCLRCVGKQRDEARQARDRMLKQIKEQPCQHPYKDIWTGGDYREVIICQKCGKEL